MRLHTYNLYTCVHPRIHVCCKRLSCSLKTYRRFQCSRYAKFLISIAHRCGKAGCGTVLVIDGNMKNCRDVCAAKHAGFVEYAGLPGRVTTGCMETPEQTSKFCSQHKPRQSSNKCSSDSPENHFGEVIEMILAKKSTRSNTFYQVICIYSFIFTTFFYTLHIIILQYKFTNKMFTIGSVAWT